MKVGRAPPGGHGVPSATPAYSLRRKMQISLLPKDFVFLFSFNLARLGFTFQEAEQPGRQVRRHTCGMSQLPPFPLLHPLPLSPSLSVR